MSSAPSTCRSELAQATLIYPYLFLRTDPEYLTAWFQTARGKPNDVLKLDENAPVPKPNAGEVLIKSRSRAMMAIVCYVFLADWPYSPTVHSAGLNPVGYKLMALSVWPVFKLPAIPELDFSGTIVDGNGTEFKTGQGGSRFCTLFR
jgi:hypothetical protein